MSQPVAKRGDFVVGIDMHFIVPEGGGKPELLPVPYQGPLEDALSPDVLVENRSVARVGTVSVQEGHLIAPKSFAAPPHDHGVVVWGSGSVLVNNKPIARNADPVETCNDPVDAPTSKIIAQSTVLSG